MYVRACRKGFDLMYKGNAASPMSCEIVDITNRPMLFECVAGESSIKMEFPQGSDPAYIISMTCRAKNRLINKGLHPNEGKLKVL